MINEVEIPESLGLRCTRPECDQMSSMAIVDDHLGQIRVLACLCVMHYVE